MSVTTAERGTFGLHLRWPEPWEGIGAGWYADCREHSAPFNYATSDAGRAVLALLDEQPPSFWTAHVAEAIGRDHKTQPSNVRRDMLRLAHTSKAALVNGDGQVWCAASIAAAWPDLKARAQALFSDAGKPPLADFAAIAKALDCTEASAQTLAWTLCEEDERVHARYAGLFTDGPQPAA
jgi:hypothetical protein